GQSSEDYGSCTVVTVDKEGVSILKDSAQLSGKEDNLPITHFKDSEIQAEFSINISGADLDKEKVAGNFTALNEDKTEEYKKLSAECSSAAEGINNCKFELEVKLSKANAGGRVVVIEAEDLAGNAASEEITIDLGYDEVGPVVSSLTTGSEETDGKLLARSEGSTFTAQITEEGIGLRKEDVILHIDTGTSQATSCEKKDNWECKWEDINSPGGGTFKASIGADSEDRLGNKFTASDEYEFIVDDTMAIVNWIRIKQKAGIIAGREAVIGHIATGDVLVIKANLTEASGIKSAVGNFTVIAEGNTEEAGVCSKEGNYIICTWPNIQITKKGAIEDKLEFTFTDNAGNEKTAEKEIIVSESVEGEPSDFYTMEQVDKRYITPIDKAVMRYLRPVYYYTVPFKLKYDGGCDSDIEVVSIYLDGSCKKGS
ncbi:unnamed protein product, partial [marine sediment metagenome]